MPVKDSAGREAKNILYKVEGKLRSSGRISCVSNSELHGK